MLTTAKALAIGALLLSAVGLLLVSEVIRPFRDLSVDGPLALVAWGCGALLAGACFFFKGRSTVIAIVALAVNLIPLVAALALAWLLSRSSFAWH